MGTIIDRFVFMVGAFIIPIVATHICTVGTIATITIIGTVGIIIIIGIAGIIIIGDSCY